MYSRDDKRCKRVGFDFVVWSVGFYLLTYLLAVDSMHMQRVGGNE